MPETDQLSESAVAVLRRFVAGELVEVAPDSKDAYRELARAGVMYAASGLVGGPDAVFRFTEEGWARRDEIVASVRS